ncbi:helix-turn-helix domain-containing protein [Aeromicrobium wangtongii]|uniref:helix-turn-helix domain-containing protein n=1 Tax=Aeromicrobium wangtongii TaxID=2969247 RepID=UPI0020174F2D|nr:helix-turn-helix transcriptional regulator [Aeromicrobium wangtongii]MCL3818095.1 helix-turn-helix transcriptional regulator [Aeromicrobium wangtongii]
MSESANLLGDYLRARRGLVTPEQAGIHSIGARRVNGLRREEVAMLAGISADYYLRLERGRDRNPSAQVLRAIARVLHLDDDNVAYMLSLVADTPRPPRRRRRAESAPEGIAALLDTMQQPAFVEGRYFDVLAANPMATALSPRLAVGGNQLRDVFLDPDPGFYADWDGMTECYASGLRLAVGADIDDPRFIELVGELSLASTRFRELWSRHDVAAPRRATLTFNHPEVGAVRLNREQLAISGTDGMHIVIYHPDAGSGDADKLALLGSSSLASAQQSDSSRR